MCGACVWNQQGALPRAGQGGTGRGERIGGDRTFCGDRNTGTGTGSGRKHRSRDGRAACDRDGDRNFRK